MGDTKTAKAIPKLLRVMREAPKGTRHYVADLSKEAGVGYGTVYVALARLETEGVVVAGWNPPLTPDGPRRRYYKLVS